MVEIGNDCVGCEQCIRCGRNIDVTHYLCDKCGSEDILYEFEGEQLCSDCVIASLDIVEGSDEY